jgi:hypothetical protein
MLKLAGWVSQVGDGDVVFVVGGLKPPCAYEKALMFGVRAEPREAREGGIESIWRE